MKRVGLLSACASAGWGGSGAHLYPASVKESCPSSSAVASSCTYMQMGTDGRAAPFLTETQGTYYLPIQRSECFYSFPSQASFSCVYFLPFFFLI